MAGHAGTCTVDGCDRETVARGWCDKHYKRWRIHGDPTHVEPRHKPVPWTDPLTDADYSALRAAVDADAQAIFRVLWVVIGEWHLQGLLEDAS